MTALEFSLENATIEYTDWVVRNIKRIDGKMYHWFDKNLTKPMTASGVLKLYLEKVKEYNPDHPWILIEDQKQKFIHASA